MKWQGSGVVDSGKLTLSSPQSLRDWMKSVEGPLGVVVKIEKRTKKRSLPANALWEALVRRYATEAGFGFGEAREMLKARHGVSYEWGPDVPEIETRGGAPYRHGTGFLFLVSTAFYTSTEFSALIDGTVRDCAEAGVFIGDIMPL